MIDINWAEILPQAILYIVTGYIFICVFRFVALKEQHAEIQHILLSSLVSGYVIVKIMNMIPFTISYEADCIGIICTGALAGYILGQLYSRNCFDKLFEKLKIRSTLNKDIWNDIVDMDYPLYLVITLDDGTIYKGYVHLYELSKIHPIVCLGAYLKISADGNIEDHTYDANQIIMLDTARAKNVEVHYYRESEKCKDIRDLISNHNEVGSPTYAEHHQNSENENSQSE